MKHLLFLTITLICLLAGLGAVARATGIANTSSRAIVDTLGLGKCDLPCWNGIIPGKTTIEEATGILNGNSDLISDLTLAENKTRLCGTFKNLSDWNVCATLGRDPDQRIKEIRLFSFASPDVMLGELIPMLGQPSAIWPCVSGRRSRVGIYFNNNVEVWAYDNQVIGNARISPDLPVRLIIFHYPSEELPYAFDLAHWHGFQTFPAETTCPTMP